MVKNGSSVLVADAAARLLQLVENKGLDAWIATQCQSKVPLAPMKILYHRRTVTAVKAITPKE